MSRYDMPGETLNNMDGIGQHTNAFVSNELS
jgi:hypothetical protein